MLLYCESIVLSQDYIFALICTFGLDYEKISLVCNLVKLEVSSISIYSDIYLIDDMFNSYFLMCYLFLFDVVAKDIHDVIKREDFCDLVLR